MFVQTEDAWAAYLEQYGDPDYRRVARVVPAAGFDPAPARAAATALGWVFAGATPTLVHVRLRDPSAPDGPRPRTRVPHLAVAFTRAPPAEG